jgi:hypothetical protein
MLYEFKCKVAGTVVMTQPVAERLLAIIGKPPAPAGVFEPEHLASAISALQSAVDRDKAGAVTAEPANGDDEQDSAQEGSKRVSLKQRAWPLLDLMKTALAAGQRITWGV